MSKATKRVTVTVSLDAYQQLEEIARETGLSLSAIVFGAVVDMLDDVADCKARGGVPYYRVPAL